MADLDLQIKISSDVTKAIGSVKKLSDSFNNLVEEISKAGSALVLFDKAGAAITSFGQKLEKASGAMKKFGRDFTQNVTAPLIAIGALSLKAVFDEAIKGLGNTSTNAFASSVQSLKKAFDDLLLTIGDRLAPIAARVTNVLTGIINAFLRLSPETQNFIIQFGIIAASIGPVVLAISAFLGIVGKLAVVFGQLVSFLPTVIAFFTSPITAVVAFAAGLASLINLFLDLKKAGVSTSEAIYKSLSIVATFLNEKVYGGLSKVLGKMSELNNSGIKGTKLGELFYGKGNGGLLEDASKSLDELSKLNGEKFDELKKEIDEKLKPLGTSLADSLTFGISSAIDKAKAAFAGLGASTKASVETQEEEDPVVAILEERARKKKQLADEELKQRATEVASTVSSGVASAFSSIADGSKTAADAFSDMARSIVSDLTQMIIRAQLFKLIMGAFGYGAGGGSGGGGSGIDTPNPRTFADGGFVAGPGTGTSDSIPARLSNGEFVMKAAAVKNLGVDFLHGLNNIGRGGVHAKTKGGVRAFADGGLVPGGTSGPPQVVIQNNGTPKDQMSTSFDPASQVTTIILQDYQKNGPISKAMQGTFGAKRGGFR